jgi:phosphate transport system permease protein
MLSAGSDVPYRALLMGASVLFGSVMVLFIYSIVAKSIPGWQAAGWSFFTSTNWNFAEGQYGALPLILGTFVTTGLALVLAVPVGVGAALATVFVIPSRFRIIVASTVELLAVVPSVIYGVWGYQVMLHWLDSKGQPWLASLTSGHWPFAEQGVGAGIMLGSFVLSVMILPTITAVSRDVLAAVPQELIEGALSLGATRGQVLRKVVVPSARSGILGAVVLGTGRALGETIAMVLLLGGISPLHPLPTNFFNTTGTLATEIANNFGDLNGPVPVGILCCLALTLMVIVGVVNLSARTIVGRSVRKLQ